MSTTLILLVLLIVLTPLAGFALGNVLARRRPLTNVLVNTKRPDDQAIRGLVDLRARGAWLVLEDAVALVDDRELKAGRVSIPRSHVAWIQHL